MSATSDDPQAEVALSVKHTATLLGISTTSAYRRIRDGSIPSIRIGARILVPVAVLERLLQPKRQEESV